MNKLKLFLNKAKTFLKKVEFSKLICTVIITATVLSIIVVSIYAIVVYYLLTKHAIDVDSAIAPVADIAVEALRGILYAVITFGIYCVYQGVQKNSRNKYGVDKDGNPQIETMLRRLDENGYGVVKKNSCPDENFEEEII